MCTSERESEMQRQERGSSAGRFVILLLFPSMKLNARPFVLRNHGEEIVLCPADLPQHLLTAVSAKGLLYSRRKGTGDADHEGSVRRGGIARAKMCCEQRIGRKDDHMCCSFFILVHCVLSSRCVNLFHMVIIIRESLSACVFS